MCPYVHYIDQQTSNNVLRSGPHANSCMYILYINYNYNGPQIRYIIITMQSSRTHVCNAAAESLAESD